MTYIDILAENTIDEKIVKALRKKINIASEIMGEELTAWIQNFMNGTKNINSLGKWQCPALTSDVGSVFFAPGFYT